MTDLAALLKTAKPGSIIALPPGTSTASLSGLAFDPPVVVTSADPKAPAAFSSLKVAKCSGLTFDGILLDVQPGPGGSCAAQVKASSGIHFRHIEARSSGEVATWRSGLSFTDCQDVSLTDSDLHHLMNASAFGRCVGMEVSRNNFHDIRVDAITAPGCCSVLIEDNSFKDSRHIDGDHGDAIQFWTANLEPGQNARDIIIRRNVMAEGDGDGTQGVFMADEQANAKPPTPMPYDNVSITENVFLGGNWRGITVADGSTNVVIRDNYLAPVVRPKGSPLATTSGIFAPSPQPNNSIAAALPDASDATVRAVLEKTGRPIPANIRKAFGFPTVDPRDARIAELEATLAAVRKAVA